MEDSSAGRGEVICAIGLSVTGVMSVRQEQSRIAQNAVFSIFAKETE